MNTRLCVEMIEINVMVRNKLFFLYVCLVVCLVLVGFFLAAQNNKTVDFSLQSSKYLL